MRAAGKFAGQTAPRSGRRISNMPPSTHSGAKGNNSRPPGRSASSQDRAGCAAPAHT
jgi:hypothetical protein